MTKEKIKYLQEKIEIHRFHLEKKYPMTQVVTEAIDSLVDMNASDNLIAPWYRSIKSFIYDIEKEIEKLESKYKSK